MLTVHQLSAQYTIDLIGTKYRHNGPYGTDVMTIIGKEPGFGILFHSKITNKEHYMYDHCTLIKET
jgi:hypothetical protein